MNIEIDTYFEILKKVSGVNLFSLDEVKPGENDSLVNKIPTDIPTQLEELQKKELKNHVKNMISELSKKEQMVISLYYYEELTLKEIAEIMKLTESRISQIHSKVIISLRSKLRKNYEN